MRSAATKHISGWAVVRNALGNPNLVKVEVGTAIGVLGHRAYGAVLLVIAYEQFGKFGAPLFATVRLLGGAVGVLVFSALAGRFRRERVLAGGFVANAVAVALLIPVLQLHTANWLLLVPIAIEGFTHSAPAVIHDALLPWLADSPAQLVASNAFSATLDTAAALVGALLTLAVLWLSGPSAVLIIVVAFGVLGACPLFAIRGIDTRGGVEHSRLVTQLAGGIGVLRRLPNARAVVIVMMFAAVIACFEHSILPSIAVDIMHTSVKGIPLLSVFATVGSFIGGIASLSAGRRSLSVSLAIGLLICASAMFVLSVTSGVAVALPLLSLFSLGMLYQGVSSRTLLQSTATGRSLDLLIGVNILIALPIQAVSNLGAGVLNETVGVRATLQVAAGVAILGAVYGLWRLTKVEKQAPTNREEIDAIRRVDAFRPLSVAAANQLADALVDQETAEDEVVVRQGEPGDDMFLIRSGVFDTTVDGEHARTLQRGDHFGEIALLFNAPRTATVRCTQAGELWHLRREDFLRAITGNTATEEAMTAIANQRLAHAGAVDLSQGGGG
jgi:predicted MFS family arabinose efflux permease